MRTIRTEPYLHQLMSLPELLQTSTTWLAWSGLALGSLTLISFLAGWGFRFRLVGATIFSLLLSGSCWAFAKSYSTPLRVEGAIYAPTVYDNGYDLVIAQVPNDFPRESIEPSLKQIAGNLKGGGRNGATVVVRLRSIEEISKGISKPVVLGEITRDIKENVTGSLKIYPLEDKSISRNTQEDLNDNENELE